MVTVPPQIAESSGLELSHKWWPLAYTMNDEYQRPQIISFSLNNGTKMGGINLVGVHAKDSESLRRSPTNWLWLADTGDNKGKRHDCALYGFPEPGPGDFDITPETWPIRYPDRPHDTEVLLIHPGTGEKRLVTKAKKAQMFVVPEFGGTLVPVRARKLPAFATDGVYSQFGGYVIFLTKKGRKALIYSTKTWRKVGSVRIGWFKQCESIALDAGGAHIWVGSEGRNSPVRLVPLPRRFAHA